MNLLFENDNPKQRCSYVINCNGHRYDCIDTSTHISFHGFIGMLNNSFSLQNHCFLKKNPDTFRIGLKFHVLNVTLLSLEQQH